METCSSNRLANKWLPQIFCPVFSSSFNSCSPFPSLPFPLPPASACNSRLRSLIKEGPGSLCLFLNVCVTTVTPAKHLFSLMLLPKPANGARTVPGHSREGQFRWSGTIPDGARALPRGHRCLHSITYQKVPAALFFSSTILHCCCS